MAEVEKSSLDYLIKPGLLTQNQKQQLEAEDIFNGPQLVAAWRGTEKRCQILQKTNIPELTLVKCVFAANLLRLKGPGETGIVQILEHGDWGGWNSVPVDPAFHLKITADRQELLAFLDEIGFSTDQSFGKRFNQMLWAFCILLYAGLLVFLLFEFRNYLFPVLSTDPNSYWNTLLAHKMAFIDLAWAVHFFSLSFVLTLLNSLGVSKATDAATKLIDEKLSARGRSTLVWTDILSLIPNKSRLLAGDTVFLWVFGGISLLATASTIYFFWKTDATVLTTRNSYFAAPAFVIPTLFLIAKLRMAHVALGRLGTNWAMQARKILAASILLRVLVALGLFFGMMYLTVSIINFVVISGLDWVTEQAYSSQAETQQWFLDSIQDITLKNELQSASDQFWTDFLAERYVIGQNAMTGMGNVLVVARYTVFGVFFAVAISTYLFVNDTKGFASLFKNAAYPLVLWLGSEVLTEWGTRLLEGKQFLLVPFTNVGLMVMASIKIAIDITHAGWQHRNHVECPHCYMLIAAHQAQCPECKQALPEPVTACLAESELQSLVQHGILSQAGLQKLRLAGIGSASDLCVAWQSSTARQHLQEQIGLSFKELIRLVVTAKLFNVQGPGKLLAREMVVTLDSMWDDLDFSNTNTLDNINACIEADDAEMIELLDFFELPFDHDLGAKQASKTRRHYSALLLVALGILLFRLITAMQPMVMFAYPEQVEASAITLLHEHFFWLGIGGAIGIALIVCLSFWLVFFGLLPYLIRQFSGAVENFLKVRPLQRVIFADTLMAPQMKQLGLLTKSSWQWIYSIIVLPAWSAIGVATILNGWNFSTGIAFVVVCILCSGTLLAVLWLHRYAYKQLAHYEDIHKHRRAHANALLFSIVLVFLLVFVGSLLFDRGTHGISGMFTGWLTAHLQQQATEIETAVGQNTTVRAWVQESSAIYEQVYLQVQDWVSASGKRVSQAAFDIYLAILLAVALGFSVFVDPKRGVWVTLATLVLIALNQLKVATIGSNSEFWLYGWMLLIAIPSAVAMRFALQSRDYL